MKEYKKMFTSLSDCGRGLDPRANSIRIEGPPYYKHCVKNGHSIKYCRKANLVFDPLSNDDALLGWEEGASNLSKWCIISFYTTSRYFSLYFLLILFSYGLIFRCNLFQLIFLTVLCLESIFHQNSYKISFELRLQNEANWPLMTRKLILHQINFINT